MKKDILSIIANGALQMKMQIIEGIQES